MDGVQCYKLNDHPDFPNDTYIPFHSHLPVEFLCSSCDAVAAMGIKDSEGHTFCRKCVGALRDPFNQLTCVTCRWKGDISSMEQNTREWESLLENKAACPNQKVRCPFNGTLKDVLRHYKRCGYTGKAPCGFCGTLLNKKAHAGHIANECPNRIVQCSFCNDDIEACVKKVHEADCPQRPGTCEHCREGFQTYLELEKHYTDCPQRPEFCPYNYLGCNHEGPRSSMKAHVSDGSHITILVDAIRRQENEIKELKKENATLTERLRSLEHHQDLTKGNVSDKQRLGGIEDSQELTEGNATLMKSVRDIEDRLKTEEYLRTNLADALEELQEQMTGLKETALKKQQEVDATIKKLEDLIANLPERRELRFYRARLN